MTTAVAFGSMGGVELSGHVEHGQADGAGASLHDGGRDAVPAGPDGVTMAGECTLRAAEFA